MVVALLDELAKLLLGRVVKCPGGGHGIDQARLGPDDQPAAIAQVIKLLRLLIV